MSGSHHRKEYRCNLEEMKSGQEKLIAQMNVNQEMKATVRASQERMEAAINSVHPNW
jgi:hypothetical protein